MCVTGRTQPRGIAAPLGPEVRAKGPEENGFGRAGEPLGAAIRLQMGDEPSAFAGGRRGDREKRFASELASDRGWSTGHKGMSWSRDLPSPRRGTSRSG